MEVYALILFIALLSDVTAQTTKGLTLLLCVLVWYPALPVPGLTLIDCLLGLILWLFVLKLASMFRP